MNPEATDNGAGAVRVSRAAALLDVSTRTIWRMIADGQLTPVRARGCTRVALQEVGKYLKGPPRG